MFLILPTPKGWKPESSLSAPGFEPGPCTHERTCVGAANTLTNWANQTDNGRLRSIVTVCQYCAIVKVSVCLYVCNVYGIYCPMIVNILFDCGVCLYLSILIILVMCCSRVQICSVWLEKYFPCCFNWIELNLFAHKNAIMQLYSAIVIQSWTARYN